MSETLWPPGAATGVGSMPGLDVREAMRVILGELPDFPHLPELPERGVGADLTGRAVGLLVDLHAEVQPSGWRVADAAGRDERRAIALLGQDLDALEELAGDWSGPLKIQVCGPWTLAATVELRYGDRMLADPGACRDLAASLGEGVVAHVQDVARRAPRAQLLLQLDEPALPGVLAGSVPTASGFGRLHPVDAEVVVAGLASVVSAVRGQAQTLVHCCAASVPLGLLARSGCSAVSVDAGLLDPRHDDDLGALLEGGTGLMLGLGGMPLLPPDVAGPSDPAATVAPVRALWRRLGLAPEDVRELAVSPTCGLAGRSPALARAALAAVREAGQRLRDDPYGELS